MGKKHQLTAAIRGGIKQMPTNYRAPPPIRYDNWLHMPGTSYHWTKPARDYRRVKYFRAQYRNWPPKDASPLHPIEPWGKQFFVHNFHPDVEWSGDPRAPGWHDIRSEYWQDDINHALSQGKDPLPEDAPTETRLCVADFRRRPFFFMTREELEHFLSEIPNLKRKLIEYQEILDDDPKPTEFELFEQQRAIVPDDYSRRNRGVFAADGKHSTRAIQKEPERRHVTSYELREKRKKASRMAYQERLAAEEAAAEDSKSKEEQKDHTLDISEARRLEVFKALNDPRQKFVTRF